MRYLPLAAALLATATLAACGGNDDDARPAGDANGGAAGGTMVVTSAADADFLLPPLVTQITGRQVTDQLFDRLADIGDDLNAVGDAGFRPRLADRWEWAADSMSIAFHIDPRARWHDGRPVRASDVAYTHRVYRDPATGSTSAPLVADIDSVSVRDSATAVVWYARRTPHQFFDAAYQLVIIPEHVYGAVKNADLRTSPVVRQPVGSGRFRFTRWEPGATIELVSDTANYRGRAKLDRVIWSITPDFAAAAAKLFAGEADFFETLRPEQIADIGKTPSVKVVPYPSLAYGYLGFNFRDPGSRTRAHPILADAGVRRALTMAVNREAVVKNVFDTLAYPGRGPFVRALSADVQVQQVGFDLAGAQRLLDSLGWRDGNNDGVREKNGRPLRFSIMVPTSSAVRQRMAVLIQEQLRQAGVQAEVEALEFNAFIERMRQRRFDSYFGAWNVDPTPGSIRQSWTSTGITGDEGSNYGAYASPRFDALVDSALAARTPQQSKAYYQQAYQQIIDDAPALWVYEPRFFAGAHTRLRPVGLRADGWWNSLADWTIPEGERIDRDRIGLAPRTAQQ
jgi:peptide/nickel transport system substrate-binding protein